MAESIVGGIKRASGWSIALGVLIILLGIIAMMAPLGSGIVAVTILGWTAIFGGIAQMFYAFHTHSGGRMVLEIIMGVVYLAAGVYLITHPVAGLLTLTLLLGWMLLGYGILAVVLAFRMRPEHGWGWILFDADRYVHRGINDPGTLAFELGVGDRHTVWHQHSVQRNQPPDCLARSPEGDIGLSVRLRTRGRRYPSNSGCKI